MFKVAHRGTRPVESFRLALDGFIRRRNPLEDSREILQPAPLFFQFFLFPFKEARLVNLRQLKTVQIDSMGNLLFGFVVTCNPFLQLDIAVIKGSVAFLGIADRFPAELVQQKNVPLLVHQLLRFVLPVNIDQRGTDFPQDGEGHQLAVHPAGALPGS